jgi:hypothetical protein
MRQTIISNNLTAHILDGNQNIDYLNVLLDDKGLLKIVESSFYSKIPQEHLCLFCHKHGFYCLPTTELIDWLKNEIDLSSTIEIGAGHGAISRFLKIPSTDSRYMEQPEIRAYYALGGQPVTTYSEDIIKLDAISAIKKYKPITVFGCWITHKYREDEHERGGNMFGVDEDWVIKNINKYIVIGNEQTHSKKRILNLPHKEYKFPWLYSRSLEYTKNIIYVWENTNLIVHNK